MTKPFSFGKYRNFTVFNPASDLEQYDACIELHRAGEVAQAMKMLQTITVEYPDFALAYNALAAFYKKENNMEAAIENMEKYCTLMPNDPFGYSVLSAYHIAAGQRPQAEEALARANELRFKSQFESRSTG